MKKKLIALIAALASMLTSTASALNLSPSSYSNDESERLREKLLCGGSNNKAVLLIPRLFHRAQRFSWLIAHGSHVSHSSHASHASHVSGTTSPSYTSPYTSTSPWYYASPQYPLIAAVIKADDLRAVPNDEGSALIKLNPDQQVLVIGLSGLWVQVKVVINETTYTGWIKAENIK